MSYLIPLCTTGILSLSALGAYVRTCRALAVHQARILYQPVGLQDGHDDHQEVIATHDDTHVLRGWVDNPGQRQAMVYCGGSSESVEMRRSSLARSFPRHTRYVVPYRGFGPNGGLTPTEHDLKKDIERLCRHAHQTHDFVDVVGRSLGTSMAAHAAARVPVRKLALITPFHSVLAIAKDRYRYAPIGSILKDKHEVWRDVARIGSPILACLADVDTITPHKFWTSLQAHFPTPPLVFRDFGKDHNSIALSDALWEQLYDFFGMNDMDNVVNDADAQQEDFVGNDGAISVEAAR